MEKFITFPLEMRHTIFSYLNRSEKGKMASTSPSWCTFVYDLLRYELKKQTPEQITKTFAYSIFNNDVALFNIIRDMYVQTKFSYFDLSWFLQADGSLTKRIICDTSSYTGKSLLYAAIENKNFIMINFVTHQLSLLGDNEERGLGFCWPNYGYRLNYAHEITPLTLIILMPEFKEIGKQLIKQGGYTCIDVEIDIRSLPLPLNKVPLVSAKKILKIEGQWEQEIEREEKAKMIKQLTNYKQKLQHLQQKNIGLKQENQQLRNFILTIPSNRSIEEESVFSEKINFFKNFP